MPRRVFPFVFFGPRSRDRQLGPHQLRDAGAALQIVAALARLGYELGEFLFNHPPERRAAPGAGAELHPIDTSSLGPEDVILVTTRPPLDDQASEDRARVERGFTSLEALLFDELRLYFAFCARSHVTLAPAIAAKLDPVLVNRAEIEFRVNRGAHYKWLKPPSRHKFQPPPRGPRRTAAWLIRVPQLWKGGPSLLTAFAMAGTETMVWAYRLRHDLSRLLEWEGFTMVEIQPRPRPPRPATLSFCDDWPIDVVLRCEPAPRRRVSRRKSPHGESRFAAGAKYHAAGAPIPSL
jgi:hypothetical protein